MSVTPKPILLSGAAKSINSELKRYVVLHPTDLELPRMPASAIISSRKINTDQRVTFLSLTKSQADTLSKLLAVYDGVFMSDISNTLLLSSAPKTAPSQRIGR